MKKTLLTTTFLVAGAIGLMAQGVIGFDNNPFLYPTSIENGSTNDFLVYSSPGVPVNDATWRAQLAFVGGNTIGTAIPFYGPDFPGVWASGVEADAGLRPVGVPNGTASAALEVRILDSQGRLLGSSAAFTHTPIVSVPPAVTDTLMLNFRGFVVPEPSTIALGVLGLGALLLFRHRK